MEFQFAVPSTVRFGSQVAASTGDVIVGMGGSKVLFIYDAGVESAGLTEGVRQSLLDQGLEVIDYNGVLANPPDTIVEETAAWAKQEGVDSLVALGGGSSIDCAKAINILLTNPAPITQYDGLGLVNAPTLPLVALPTTAGTASEVTSFTIITDTVRKKKMVIGGPNVGADMALLDPELTVGLPPDITASTGMDALTHAIEAYVSKGAMVPTDVNAVKAIELIAQYIKRANEDGTDREARENMLLGSMLAGFAFNSAVLGLVHSIAHPLSVHCGLPHGVANACVLPYVMAYNAPAVPERMREIARALGIDVTGQSHGESAQAAVDLVSRLRRDLAIPSLSALGVRQDHFDRVAEDALQEISTLFNPKQPTKEDVLSILEQAW